MRGDAPEGTFEKVPSGLPQNFQRNYGERANMMPLNFGDSASARPYVSAEIPPAGAPAGFDGTPQAFALK